MSNEHAEIPPPPLPVPTPVFFSLTFTAGSVASLGVDVYNRFTYLFFYLKPCADVLQKAGYPVLALDGTHVKHERKGVVLALVGRDMNDKLRTLAFMICRAEDKPNYEIFASLCKRAGLDTLFTHSGVKVPCFCDRDKGMTFFFDIFKNLVRLKCTWHLIRNVRDAIRKTKGGGNFEDNNVFRIQRSRTEEEYNSTMEALASKCPAAADYLRKVDKDDWVDFAIWERHKVYTFGLRTNQMAESINGANVFIREKSCLSLALALLQGESEKLAEIRTMVIDPSSKFIANKQLVTPSVAKKIGIQTKGATHWTASCVTEKIGTVTHNNSSDAFHAQTVVDLNNLIACKNPLCDHQKKHMLHCCHVLAFLRDMGKLE